MHSTPAGGSGTQDEMSISNEAQVMSKIMQRVKETPDIREERVNELNNKQTRNLFRIC